MAVKGSDECRQRQREYMRVYLSDQNRKDQLNAKKRDRRKGADGDKIRILQKESYYRRREEVLKKNKERYQANPQRARMQSRKSKYGLSQEAYEGMLAQQDGRCAICAQKRKLVVDHCHDTDRVRSLLCSPCNTAIGLFKEDPIRIRAALEYLASK